METADLERDFAARPGFLIRRLHQLHLALFAEECAGFEVTPVQYSIMSVVDERPGMDQSRISEELGVDRAALANLAARLEETGLLRRITSRLDRRQKLLSLTPQGKNLLMRMREPVNRAHARTIEPLEPEARKVFIRLLVTLLDTGNYFGAE